MSEDILDPAATPPLPAGLGAATAPPPAEQQPGVRRSPLTPLTRLPAAAGQPAAAAAPAPSPAPSPPPAPTAAAPPAPASTPTPGPTSAPPPGAPAAATPAAAAPGPPGAGEKTDAAAGPDKNEAAGPVNDTPGAADKDAAAAKPDPEAVKPAISPNDALSIATNAMSPALQAALGLPASLAGLGSGLLAPFAQILSQFGQGTPAMPASNATLQKVIDQLNSGDPTSAVTGAPGQAYQEERATEGSQAAAMQKLEANLRTTLAESAANTTMGREKIDQIIAQVTSALQSLGPVMNTPAGQMAVIGIITNGLQAAGAVLTQAVGKDALNAGSIKTMASDYIKDLNAAPSATGAAADGDQRTVLASAVAEGGPTAWAIKALAANGITDPRAVRNWLPGLLTMGKRESANNPRAVNDWDGNARAGIPSKGWMQTIEPTFNAHWRPGTSRNIFDPVANAAAAIHYVMSRYGVSPDGSNLMARVQQANPYAPPKGY